MTTGLHYLRAVFLLCGLASQAAVAGEVRDGFTFAAGGDLLGPYRTFAEVNDERFNRGVISLFQKADAGFANQEGTVLDAKGFAGAPMAVGSTYYTPTAAARDLKAMGINMMLKANNHATDWGTEGLVASMNALKAAGILYGGAGLSEAEARGPQYLDTPKGRIAIVGTASTFSPAAQAAAPRNLKGITTNPRPGISVLRVRPITLMTPDKIEQLRTIFSDGSAANADIQVGNRTFRPAKAPGTTWEMNKSDQAAIIAAIREARKNADFVVFAIHAHETEDGDEANTTPADFQPILFHEAIDAGADAVVRSGPHILNGIEIYNGKPIFYNLGSLWFDFGGVRSLGSLKFTDDWYETVVPVTTYSGGKVREIRLHPLTIDFGDTGGAPHPANAEEAKRILERMKDMSAAFGTDIQIERGVGVIRPKP